MAKMLSLFEGKKRPPETSHEKLTKYGWDRAEVHAGAAVDHWGDKRVYTHSEHPGHAIHFNTKTGDFKHTVHHSYDLEKHLAKHHDEHEKVHSALRDWQHSFGE